MNRVRIDDKSARILRHKKAPGGCPGLFSLSMLRVLLTGETLIIIGARGVFHHAIKAVIIAGFFF